MSVEAFVLPYEKREPAAFLFTDVLTAFGEAVIRWESERGCLHVRTDDPPNSCHVFGDKDSAETGAMHSLLIDRPLVDATFWEAVIRLLAATPSFLFFSDETTPMCWDLRFVEHFPADLMAALGQPICVKSAADILAHRFSL